MKLDFKIKAIAFVVVVFAGLLWVNSQFASAGNVNVQQQKNTSKAQPASKQDIPYAPAFALQDINGNTVSLADYRGKVVFVNFWATWCPPCRAEIPHFVDLNQDVS